MRKAKIALYGIIIALLAPMTVQGKETAKANYFMPVNEVNNSYRIEDDKLIIDYFQRDYKTDSSISFILMGFTVTRGIWDTKFDDNGNQTEEYEYGLYQKDNEYEHVDIYPSDRTIEYVKCGGLDYKHITITYELSLFEEELKDNGYMGWLKVNDKIPVRLDAIISVSRSGIPRYVCHNEPEQHQRLVYETMLENWKSLQGISDLYCQYIDFSR